MSLDGFLMNAHCRELDEMYRGAKLEKVHQPSPHTLTLQLSTAGKRHKLVASVDPQLPRLLVSTEQFENPLTPPFFCLLLRKHIEGSRLERISMPGFERVVFLHFASRDELGNPAMYRLCIELTGRHSNIVLTHDNGVIVDAIKRISLSTSALRPLLPGLRYELPPEQGKTDPREIKAEHFLAKEGTRSVANTLAETVQGLSLLLARELAYQHNMSKATVNDLTDESAGQLALEVRQLACKVISVRQETGYMYVGDKVLFHVFPLDHLSIMPVEVAGVNALIAQALSKSFANQSLESLRLRLGKSIHSHIDKNERKIAALNTDIAQAQQRDEYKRYGELLYANIGTCILNGPWAEVTDYYSESLERVQIPIDPKLGPMDNAKAYFKRYNRALNTEKYGRERLTETQSQQEYLLSLRTSVEQADDIGSLREIEEEMREQGLLSKAQSGTNKKRTVDSATEPRRYVSPDGLLVEVGRNNLQNDQLVKQASPHDLWLHIQKAPGSHVLVRAQGPVPDSTIEYAANLAAYFSSQRSSSLVPIDFTERKHVRRPNGAKPGYVIYENQRTIYVRDPKEPESRNP